MCTFWTLDLSRFLKCSLPSQRRKRLAASLIEGVFREETRGCDSSWTSDGDELLSVSSEGSRRRARFYCSACLMEASSQAADRKTETAAMQESFRGENKNSWIWTYLSVCRPEAHFPCVTATELRGSAGQMSAEQMLHPELLDYYSNNRRGSRWSTINNSVSLNVS